MSVELSYSASGEGPPLLILHGLFGSARNWGTIAKKLGESHRVHVLDLRNHGASPWAPTMTYREMAGDVRAFIERHGLAGATVLGHSMGGKTAMMLALEHGGLVGRLIVVDIAPVSYGHTHRPLIEAMLAADPGAATRRAEVDARLAPAVPEAPLRAFLLQNLVAEGGQLRWRINLEALNANMDALIGFPDDLQGLDYAGPALFLAGGRSDYLLAEHHGLVRRLFPGARIESIPDSGHWVHAENPAAFLARVQSFLDGEASV